MSTKPTPPTPPVPVKAAPPVHKPDEVLLEIEALLRQIEALKASPVATHEGRATLESMETRVKGIADKLK